MLNRARGEIARRAFAEFLGTAFLVVAVIGSGIAASRLSPGDLGLQLLENSAATAAALVAIILALREVSGAHVNPIVSLVDCVCGSLSSRDAGVYVGAQVLGAVFGAVVANLMFGIAAVSWSTQHRAGSAHLLAEVVATFGLVVVVFSVSRSTRADAAPYAVAGYIAAAYWCTSSTSFANPAVTIARACSNTFTGIAPASVPGFVAAQLVGGALALGALRILFVDVATVPTDLERVGAEGES